MTNFANENISSDLSWPAAANRRIINSYYNYGQARSHYCHYTTTYLLSFTYITCVFGNLGS